MSMGTQAQTPVGLSRRSLISLSLCSLGSFALLALLLARLVAAGHATASAPVSPVVGHAAPNFAVTVWNSAAGAPSEVRLSDLKGKPVVLNFWASWCSDCVEEQSVLESAWQKYQARGVMFVGIAFRDEQSAGTAFLRQNGVTYPCGPDAGGTAPVDYAVTGVPETVFINARGVVMGKSIGAVDDGGLDKTIQSLLSQPGGAA
jgi:cytochrome c biogenesis protein CcmG/thiol:disulfide interchange protein DsbE